MFVSSAARRLAVLGLLGGGIVVLSAACSEPAPPPPPPPPPVKTTVERVARYQDCWKYFNDKAWDQFQTCYTDNAVNESVDQMPASAAGRAAIIEASKAGLVSFPDRHGELRLVLANGERVLGVAMWTATNTGDLPPGPDGKAVPATGKPIGFPIAHTGEWNATGDAVVHDASYVDEGTLMAQLGLSPMPARPVEKATGAPATVVIAKNDDAEKANLSTARAMFDVINKHDVKGLEGYMAENYKGITIAAPVDQNKKEALAGTKEMFGGFPDEKLTPAATWAAGDYVVVEGTFEGTNTGDMPSMKMKKTGNKVSARFVEILKLSGGKVTEDWLFYNGAAMERQLAVKK
jgi:predicted ester cyclase